MILLSQAEHDTHVLAALLVLSLFSALCCLVLALVLPP